MDKKNLGIVRQYFASVVWSHKIHMKCHEILRIRNDFMKVINIGLIFLILLSLYLQGIYHHALIPFISGLLTIIEAVILITTLSFNFGELSLRHKLFADDLKIIRDEYLALICDISNGRDINIENERDRIKEKISIIDKHLPEQVGKCLDKARESLGINKENQTGDYTYSDEEIDKFLPRELRIGTQ